MESIEGGGELFLFLWRRLWLFFRKPDVFFMALFATALCGATVRLWGQWDGIELAFRKAHYSCGVFLVLCAYFRFIPAVNRRIGLVSAIVLVLIFAGMTIPLAPMPFPVATVIYYLFWIVAVVVVLAKRALTAFNAVGLGLMFFFPPAVAMGPVLDVPSHYIVPMIIAHHISTGPFIILAFIHFKMTQPKFSMSAQSTIRRLIPALLILPVVYLWGVKINKNLGVDLNVPIEPERTLLDVRPCEECHEKFVRDWRVSSHRFAGSNKAYDAILGDFVARFGKSESVFCDRCHNPMLVYCGVNRWTDPRAEEFLHQGVNCAGCHRGEDGDVNLGNGLIKFRPYREIFPGADFSRPDVIDAYKDMVAHSLYLHVSYMHYEPNKPQLCGACHKVTMPAKYTGGKKLVLGDVYTPWLHSESARDGVTCVDCHYHMLRNRESGYGGYVAHKTPGLNQALEILVDDEDMNKQVEDQIHSINRFLQTFISGNMEVSKMDSALFYNEVWLGGRERSLKYIQRPFMHMTISSKGDIAPGKPFHLIVETRNDSGAHIIPTGLLDLVNLWLRIEVLDDDGKRIYLCGDFVKGGMVDPDAFSLGSVLYDANHQVIANHYFWDIRSASTSAIPIGGTITADYEIFVPAAAQLPLTAQAGWRYRRYNMKAVEELFGKGVIFPQLILAKAQWSGGGSGGR